MWKINNQGISCLLPLSRLTLERGKFSYAQASYAISRPRSERPLKNMPAGYSDDNSPFKPPLAKGKPIVGEIYKTVRQIPYEQ